MYSTLASTASIPTSSLRGEAFFSPQRSTRLPFFNPYHNNSTHKANPGNIQTKLEVGPADDIYERQADQVADAVVSGKTVSANTSSSSDESIKPGKAEAPAVQMKCATCDDEQVQRKPKTETANTRSGNTTASDLGTGQAQGLFGAELHHHGPTVQRRCTDCEPESAPEIMLKSLNSTGFAVANTAIPASSSGSRVAPQIRQRVEPMLQADLSSVQVHNDTMSMRAAASLGARAFTHHNHIYLGAGESETDLGLMAHELTHTKQQAQPGNNSALIQRKEDDVCGEGGAGFSTLMLVNAKKQKDTANFIPRAYYWHPTGKNSDMVKMNEQIIAPKTGEILRHRPTTAVGPWWEICFTITTNPGKGPVSMGLWIHKDYLLKPDQAAKKPATASTSAPAKSASIPAAPKPAKTYAELERSPLAETAKRYAVDCQFQVTDATNPAPNNVPSPCAHLELQSSAIVVDEFTNAFVRQAHENAKFLLSVSKDEINTTKAQFTDQSSALMLHRSATGLINKLSHKAAVTTYGHQGDGNMDSSHWGGDGSEKGPPFTENDQKSLDAKIETMTSLSPIFADAGFQKVLATRPTIETFETAAANNCNEKIKNIGIVLAELAGDTNKIFKLNNLIHYTRQQLAITDNSVRDQVLKSFQSAYTGSATADLLVLLDIAFVAIGFIPHPIAKGVALVGGLATGLAQAQEDYYDYLFQQNARNVSFEDAALLVENDPDLIWLAFAVLSILPDAADAVKALRSSAKTFKQTGDLDAFKEQLAKAKVGNAVKRKVAEVAGLEKKMIGKEAKLINEALTKPPKEAAKQLALPVNKHLAENVDKVKMSDEAGVFYTVDLPGSHKAVKKISNKWCVRSVEVCDIPVKKEIDVAIDNSVMDKPIPEKYLKPDALGAKPVSGRGEAARKDFETIRERYKTQLNVNDGEDIHHAIELQVLDRFPDAFKASELNRLDNFRGIPMEFIKNDAGAIIKKSKQLHNHYIRWRWNHYYADLEKQIRSKKLDIGTEQYKQFVRDHLMAGRDAIDYAVGQFFTQFKRGEMKLP
jgi:hypothetical protein